MSPTRVVTSSSNRTRKPAATRGPNLKLTTESGNVRRDARDNALRHEVRPQGAASQVGDRLQGKPTSKASSHAPGRTGTNAPAEGVIIQTLGSIKVAVKDGYVVAAIDPDGSKWTAADLQKPSRPVYRRLTHVAVLVAAMIPVTMTVASAHQATPQQRVTTKETPLDFPVSLPIPSPSPSPKPPPPPAPKPAPRPVYVAPSQAAIANIIRAAAAKWGVDPNQLIRVAMCESGLNPNSYNASSGATGLFQFKPPTFYQHGGTNIWDPTDQANVAAHMFAQGLAYEWTCR